MPPDPNKKITTCPSTCSTWRDSLYLVHHTSNYMNYCTRYIHRHAPTPSILNGDTLLRKLHFPLWEGEHHNVFSSWWLNQPIWKILVKLDHFPKDRGENTKYLNFELFSFRPFQMLQHQPLKKTIPRCFLDSGRQSFGPSKGNSTNPKTQPAMQYPNDGSMGFGKFTHMNGWLWW